MKQIAAAGVAALSLCMLIGCSAASESTSAPAPELAPSVEEPRSDIYMSSAGSGQQVAVQPLALVRVKNVDSVPRNLVSEDGLFRTRDLPPGGDAVFTAPGEPGRYAFLCTLEPGFAGVLIVLNSAESSQLPNSTLPADGTTSSGAQTPTTTAESAESGPDGY